MANIRNRGLYRSRGQEPTPIEPTDSRQLSSTNSATPVFHSRPATPEEVSYRNGYVQGQRREGDYVRGRLHERHLMEQDLHARDNSNAARGLLIGIALTSLVGAVIGAFLFLDVLNREPEVLQIPVFTDSTDADSTENQPNQPPSQVRQNNTQVRERVIERVQQVIPIPQPQPSAPAPQAAPPAQPNPQPVQPAQSNVQPAQPAQSNVQSEAATAEPAVTQPNSQTPTSESPVQSSPTGTVTPNTAQ